MTPLHIIFCILVLSALIQFYYYVFFYLRSGKSKTKKKNEDKEPVSVIICAKNEAENLKKNLPKVLEQKYENFEVIVVDDGSSDETPAILHELSKKYKNLRFTTITEDKKFTHGKKLAITIGVKSAKSDVLLFTDADCVPESEYWIKSLQQYFSSDIEIVLGYGGYFRKKGLLNKLIRFDTLWIAMQYFGFAIAGKTYMGVGRNLAYRKSLFFKNKGFARHSFLLSGDDDLFVNENATPGNVSVALNPEAYTRSAPKTSWSEWFKQKQRHITTFPYFKASHKFLLLLEPTSRMLFYITSILLLINHILPQYVLLMIGIRLFIFFVSIKAAMNRFKEKDLFFISIIFDIILPILFIFIQLSNRLTGRNHSWK